MRAAPPDVHGTAGLALAQGDGLRALGLVGRAEDVLGLTLRGIAYAQIGDLELGRRALERAARMEKKPLARARINAALVEISMADGDAAATAIAARASAMELARLGDPRNAAMQSLVLARAEVLLGRLPRGATRGRGGPRARGAAGGSAGRSVACQG